MSCSTQTTMHTSTYTTAEMATLCDTVTRKDRLTRKTMVNALVRKRMRQLTRELLQVHTEEEFDDIFLHPRIFTDHKFYILRMSQHSHWKVGTTSISALTRFKAAQTYNVKSIEILLELDCGPNCDNLHIETLFNNFFGTLGLKHDRGGKDTVDLSPLQLHLPGRTEALLGTWMVYLRRGGDG